MEPMLHNASPLLSFSPLSFSSLPAFGLRVSGSEALHVNFVTATGLGAEPIARRPGGPGGAVPGPAREGSLRHREGFTRVTPCRPLRLMLGVAIRGGTPVHALVSG